MLQYKIDFLFSLCDDLMELNKRMFPDSEIAAQMVIARRKRSYRSRPKGVRFPK